METFKAINRFAFSLNRVIFILAILAHMIATLSGASGFEGVTEWIVNIAFLLLGIGALSAFVEHFLTQAAKEPLKLFYLQLIGIITLILYIFLIDLIETMIQA